MQNDPLFGIQRILPFLKRVKVRLRLQVGTQRCRDEHYFFRGIGLPWLKVIFGSLLLMLDAYVGA